MVVLAATSFFVGCTITDPSTDLEIRITMPNTGAVIGGQILDAQGRTIYTPVTLTITGPDAGHIVDLLNNQLSSLTTSSGFVVMAVNDTIPHSSEDPLRFTLNVTADGYIEASKNITLTGQENFSFDMRLISTDIANLPPGLSGDEETGSTDGSGALSVPLTVSPPANPNSGAQTSIEIPAGTRFLDADGNTLSGDITVSLIFGDMRSDTLQQVDQYFPGDRNNPLTDDGNAVYPLSIIMLNITDGSGRSASEFDAPITFTTQVAGGTFNPNTGQSFAAGDTVVVLQFSEDGTWSGILESLLTGPDGNGNFTATFSIPAGSGLLGNIKGGSFTSGSDIVLRNRAVVISPPRRLPRPRFVIILVPNNWRHMVNVFLTSEPCDPRVKIESNISLYRHNPEFTLLQPGNTDFAAVSIDFEYNGERRNMGTIPANNNRLDLSNTAWPWPETKTVTYHIYAKMPEGRDPSEIRTSGLAVRIADAADTSSWRAAGSVQSGTIAITDLVVGHSYWLKGTYTFRGETRTANTAWTRQVTAQTDTLQYWYQLTDDEADEYEKGG